jgi:hypothetical protein
MCKTVYIENGCAAAADLYPFKLEVNGIEKPLKKYKNNNARIG